MTSTELKHKAQQQRVGDSDPGLQEQRASGPAVV